MRLVARHGGAVRAIRRHRVVGVAREDDPRGDRNLLADEAVRIAAAVPALVTGAHDLADAREQAADPIEHELTLDRVVLDHLELALGERRRLVEDLLGDRDLADVVEHRGELELLPLVRLDARARPLPR